MSTSTVSRYLTKYNTRKLLTRPAADRFTDLNRIYTQAFIDALHRQDVASIKFFDESGFALPDVANPRYGRSPRGDRAIEIHDRKRIPNKTLNLLIGINGVMFANILDGPSNTDTYVDFFLQAINATNNAGDFALRPGDLLIVDNCPLHHHRAEEILKFFLYRHGIEYIFAPTYSPHLNPVELCFQHIKNLFKFEPVRSLAKENLQYAIMHCVNSISSRNCEMYYRHVGYLNV